MEGLLPSAHYLKQTMAQQSKASGSSTLSAKQNHVSQVGAVVLYGVPIVSLVIENQERLCLAQISNTLLKEFSYNEIHNRRVALGITCVQCTPVQLEILRRAGAMPVSSRRCGMITRREAERLCKSFLGDNTPPQLPEDFAFSVHHECAWGCRGAFLPSRYNSSRAKCIKCCFCGLFFSPNKFIFHSHRTSPNATYVQPDAANFNSWRRHMKLSGSPPENVVHAWEDVKAMFNGGTRKRMMSSSSKAACELKERRPSRSPPPLKELKLSSAATSNSAQTLYQPQSNTSSPVPVINRVPPFPDIPLPITMMDYVWDSVKSPYQFSPYLPWLNSAKRSMLGLSGTHCSTEILQVPTGSASSKMYQSAFRPVYPLMSRNELHCGLKRYPPIEPKRNGCDANQEIIVFAETKPLKKEIHDDSNDSCGGKILDGYDPQKCARRSTPEFRNDTFVDPVVIQREAEDYSTTRQSPDLDQQMHIDCAKAEEDETVDIESTEDQEPTGDICDLKVIDAPRPTPKHKIWTIARYSENDEDIKRTDCNRSRYSAEFIIPLGAVP